MPGASTDEILAMIQRVAAALITPRFTALSADEVFEKKPGDLVTVADREAEVEITRWLHVAYPDALVVGEEASAADPGLPGLLDGATHAFTVDPVDGTRNFVHGSPDHGVMLAELRSGTVMRSWIWQPQYDTAYVAELGKGARRNGILLEPVVPPDEVGRLRVSTSTSRLQGRVLPPLAPLLPTRFSCAIDYPLLATGGVDAVHYRHGHPWDHAPGALLVGEVGGVVGSVAGEQYAAGPAQGGGMLACADSAVYQRVRPVIAEALDA